MKSVFRFAVLAAVAALTAGCASYKFYEVESTFRMAGAQATPPSITKAQDFARSFPRIRTIAVKAPDHCVSESQSQRAGNSAETNVMQTSCGVEMAQIESSLAKAGYDVVSWKVLQNEMHVAKSHLEAARALKADALFQINSLERSVSRNGQDARWERRYFLAYDYYATNKQPTAVDTVTAGLLDNFAKANEVKATGIKEVLSATINASVTLAENGRAIWFYEWNHQQALDNDENVVTKTNVYCVDGYCQPYVATNPYAQSQQSQQLVQGSSEALSVASAAADRRRAVHDKLMKQVVEDMVGRFTAR